ncbi:hypothetical protein COT95_00990 [Candidatus Falkowbacteria bacterium CG10_big_fil_rev_8_21_14_0_10_37_6]|uniref:Uncharacterized protein n=1 Tax=Candidatus Falkowbacteria bacterium CG10_big_fil_rev_8_21_14_0_10_37_6 TaxID=1974563 RepID=A0A2H0V9L7_9BACT|nr:MAG: hypothetical protein COT95_00990 [Candidatus Falkowbacteria bacterium CG10_big_fil_rev_8_21_14_0_10_37_6]
MLKIELSDLDEVRILMSTLKISFASIGAGVAVQAMKFVIWPYIDMTRFWGVFTQGLVSGIAGIVVFMILAWVARSEELEHFVRSIKIRTKREKITTEDAGEARGL